MARMRPRENGLLDLEGSGGRVVAAATAATAPKIPPHPAISRRTSCLQTYPRGAGMTQTPPTLTETETLGAHKENQKVGASLVSSGPRTHPHKPTDLLTPKGDPNNQSHPTATKQSILPGSCRVPPTPTKTCQAKGRSLPPSMAEAMVAPVPMLPAKDHKLLLQDPRPEA